MRRIVKTFRRSPTGRIRDRNGGLPRLSDGVAHALRCPASPQRTLLAENLGKPSLWVMISDPWYYVRAATWRAVRRPARTGRPGHCLATVNTMLNILSGPARPPDRAEFPFQNNKLEASNVIQSRCQHKDLKTGREIFSAGSQARVRYRNQRRAGHPGDGRQRVQTPMFAVE